LQVDAVDDDAGRGAAGIALLLAIQQAPVIVDSGPMPPIIPMIFIHDAR
jgi:hypothetical protein